MRRLAGSVTLFEAFAAVYCGFFTSFTLYELQAPAGTRPAIVASAGLPSLRPAVAEASVATSSELRGVWIDRTSLPRTREECRKLVARLSEIGITAIFPETFSRTAAVCYDSRVAPDDPAWHAQGDVLGWLVEEAHARGMKVHAWVWAMCAGTAYQPGPKVRARREWLGRNAAGMRVSRFGTYWLCPRNPEALAYLSSVYEDLVKRYQLDGVNLDYIRVEDNLGAPYCTCSRCRRDYLAWLGPRSRAAWPPKPLDATYLEWREGMLDRFVRDVSARLKAIRPGLAVSACVYPLARWAKRVEGQNWSGWLTEGYLDFACALTYTKTRQRGQRLLSQVAEARGRGLAIYPSVGLYLCRAEEVLAAELLADCRDAKLGGFMLFSLKDVLPSVERCLQGAPAPAGALVALAREGNQAL